MTLQDVFSVTSGYQVDWRLKRLAYFQQATMLAEGFAYIGDGWICQRFPCQRSNWDENHDKTAVEVWIGTCLVRVPLASRFHATNCYSCTKFIEGSHCTSYISRPSLQWFRPRPSSPSRKLPGQMPLGFWHCSNWPTENPMQWVTWNGESILIL